jgi:shikimate kinase
MKSNIALIGFMGTGKTVVGKSLAEKLGKEFIELDALIERKEGRTISEIFQQDGELGFRELEIEVTKEVSEKKNVVIACGGGIVLNKINIDWFKKESYIVYLTASPAVILRRTSGDKNIRPLLKTADRTATISELLKFRRPFYERAAEITINTSKLGVDAVVERIIARVNADESFAQKK